jgi:hypothetical protein
MLTSGVCHCGTFSILKVHVLLCDCQMRTGIVYIPLPMSPSLSLRHRPTYAMRSHPVIHLQSLIVAASRWHIDAVLYHRRHHRL